VTVKIAILQDVTPCYLVGVCHHFKGANCLHYQTHGLFYLYFETFRSFIQMYDGWIV